MLEGKHPFVNPLAGSLPSALLEDFALKRKREKTKDEGK